MTRIQDLATLTEWKKSVAGRRIGFVPTMGALHQGHASLLQKASAENEVLVLSIYVNPTQFNQNEDFEKYPKTLEADLKIAAENQVDMVFLPDYQMIYPDGYEFKIIAPNLTNVLCGRTRPGHFDGVLTVVNKLFHLVEPTTAYFGEKDYQQFVLIQKMAEAFFLNTKVISLPTVRATSGLALSSRNERLSPADKAKAAMIFESLTNFRDQEAAKRFLQNNGFEVEYLEEHWNRRFVAAWLSGVRLIDNISLTDIRNLK